jgi:hypothetical protein
VEVERLADGLWRWTTTDVVAAGCPPGRAAASVYLETSDGVLLFDPAVPADGSADATRFWGALDADVARLDRPVVVLLTRPRHARATAAILGRYAERGATAWVPWWSSDPPLQIRVERFDAGAALPGGVTARVVPEIGGEAAYELPGGGWLVVGDVLPPTPAPRVVLSAHVEAAIGRPEGPA